MVSSTIKDPKISGMIKANFIPYAVDMANAPADLKMLLQAAGEAHPYVVYLNDKLQPLHSSSGMRDIEEMAADLEKVLENKQLAMSKANEAELDKQLGNMEKALEDKHYKEVTVAWNALNKLKGYSKSRQKAYELMDKAQADVMKKQADAVTQVKKDEYAKAKDLLGDVVKDFAGLPIGDEAKNDLESLKLIESANQLTKDQKGNSWKTQAVTKLRTALTKYPDSPMAPIALKKVESLLKY